MLVQKDFLNKLKDFGLNSYESKLWVALLSRGISTAGELSDISNVPRSRAYDVLESLEKKGFIIVKVGKPIKYMTVTPSEVIERVKRKVLEEAEQRNKILSQLRESNVLEELSILHTEGIKAVNPTDRSGAFRGREKGYEHLEFLVKNAKKSVIIVTSKEGLGRKYDLLANYFKKAVKSGLDVKISVSAGADKQLIENWSQFAKVKESKSNARFIIIDEKDLLLFLTDDKKVHKSYDCAVWIEAPSFVEYFMNLFEKEWNGKPN